MYHYYRKHYLKLLVVYAVSYDHCHCDKIRNQKMEFNEMLNAKADLKALFCRQVDMFLFTSTV